MVRVPFRSQESSMSSSRLKSVFAFCFSRFRCFRRELSKLFFSSLKGLVKSFFEFFGVF